MNSHSMKAQAHDAANSAAADQSKGKAKQFIGKAKEKIGDALGDDELSARGSMQRADGKKDEIKGNIKEKIEDVKDSIKGGAEVVKEKLDGMRH